MKRAALSPQEFEAAAQVASVPRVLIPFDPETRRVLRGMYCGMALRDAEAMEVGHLLRTHSHVRVRTVTLRPWWRLWRPTPHALLTPAQYLEVLV